MSREINGGRRASNERRITSDIERERRVAPSMERLRRDHRRVELERPLRALRVPGGLPKRA